MDYPKQMAINTCIAILKGKDSTKLEEWIATFALHNIDAASVQKLMRAYKDEWIPEDEQ